MKFVSIGMRIERFPCYRRFKKADKIEKEKNV